MSNIAGSWEYIPQGLTTDRSKGKKDPITRYISNTNQVILAGAHLDPTWHEVKMPPSLRHAFFISINVKLFETTAVKLHGFS